MAKETFDLPDGHRTVELRALSRRSGTRTLVTPGGVVLLNPPMEFGGVYGAVPPTLLGAFLERHGFTGQLLFVAETPPAIPGLRFSRALVFGKEPGAPAPLAPLPPGFELRKAAAADDFSDFEDSAMEELYDALRKEPMFVVAKGNAVLSAAYAAWRSERHADISVDTVPAARGQGLAAQAAQALVKAIEAEGLVPVWGALEENQPSLRLARRLGFVVEKGPLYLAMYPGEERE